jgi:hypothetical protein
MDLKAPIHLAVLQLKLGAGFVFRELRRPIGLGQGRNGPGDRLPFGNRQAGIRQPRQTADDDHRRDQHKDDRQPDPDPAPRAFISGNQARRRRNGRPGPNIFKQLALFGHGHPLRFRARD